MEGDQHQEIGNDGALSCESKEFSTNNHNSDAVEESENSVVSPANRPTVIDFSDKIKVLKEEHALLLNQMKEIKNSFFENEVSRALQLLIAKVGTLEK